MRKIALFLCTMFFLIVHSCLGFNQPAIKKTDTMVDSLKYIDAINKKAILIYHRNADSTFYLASWARRAAERQGYDKGKADALNNIGIFFVVKGNLNMAMRYYNQSYTLYSKLNDSVNCVKLMMNMALVYWGENKHQRAIEKFDAAMSMGRNLRQDSIMSLVISNYILSYPNKFKGQTKDNLISNSRQIALNYHDTLTVLVIDQLIADDLIARGKRTEGLALLRQTIDTAINKKLYYLSMDIVIDMADHLAKTDPGLAIAYYKKGLSIANENRMLYYRETITRKLYDFYTRRNDIATAAIYSRQLISLYAEKDSIENSTGIDYLDYALKEEQINSLVERSKYQMILIALTAVICLLVIIALFIFRQSLKKTRKLNEQVTIQNSQMKATLEALEQSQAENTNLLKIVAHDLRSPVAGICSVASLMIEDKGRSEDDLEMLKLIVNSCKDSLELVSDLLRQQFKTDTLSKSPVNLAEMLRYCVSLLKSDAELKGQQINLHVKPITLPANREKLWRVVSNLIANAIKFSPNQSSIDIEMIEGADYVRIGISDEGIGIPVEIEDKIFDMFTEAKRPGTAGEQPFGLGLAISRQIMVAHGGKIWFERKKNAGTIFFIELPYQNHSS